MKLLDVHSKHGLVLVLACSLMSNVSVAQEVTSENFRDDCQSWADGDFRADRGQLGDAFQCLFRKIDKLELQLRPFKKAAGAVIAFDRSEEDACPAGWSKFAPAGGRMVLGAGVNTNPDQNGNALSDYPSFQDDKSNAVGGEERVTLSVNEMPSHNHVNGNYKNLVQISGSWTGKFFDPSNGEIDSRNGAGLLPAGGNQAHNNMPPYISLYYCKRN